MDFPILLKNQINALCDGVSLSELSQNSSHLSETYRGSRIGKERLLQTSKQALVYAVTRMPATFGAIAETLEKISAIYDFNPQTMLDVGAGTGACGWAAESFFDLQKLVCLEREDVMRSLGQSLMKESDIPLLQQSQWQTFDLIKDELPSKADLVTASYILNELHDAYQEKAILKLWQATEQVLLIVEPGTPKVFANLLKLRDILLQAGAYVIAPCPHQQKCPLKNDDWCHFSARIARSRLHRQAKSAEMGYEDEKYCYMAFSHQPLSFSYQRILKKPMITKAEVAFDICSFDGKNNVEKISVKNKSMYKKAKKLAWGDILA